MHDYASMLHTKQALTLGEKSASLGKSKVAVVGARGYSGLELCRLLLKHPFAELAGVFATDNKFKLQDYLMEDTALQVPTWSMADFEGRMVGLHTVFLATPAEVSAELAPKALKAGVNVIDVSGAFRLKSDTTSGVSALYSQWYKMEHPCPELVNHAQFGLQPFVKPTSGKGAKLIANPGCFATAALIALVPLLKAGLIDTESIVVDAKSGTTGAGKKAEEALLFSEIDGDFKAYKVGAHQHTPEVVGAALALTGAKIDPFFTTHLLNVRRGILASIYARVLDTKDAQAKVGAALKEAYAGYPLVKISEISASGADPLLSLKKVVGTSRVHLAYKVNGNKLFLFAALDNLLKGAASQAVENFNQLLDAPVATGLSGMEGVL